MEELSLTTPALLFSAVSLILLAYTKEQHLPHPSKVTRAQIDNLRRRLHLTRTMQLLGVTSLFLCVVTMFLIYVFPSPAPIFQNAPLTQLDRVTAF